MRRRKLYYSLFLGTFVSAINCDKCKYSYLLPESPLDYDTKWKCLDCDNTELNEVKQE